MPVRAHGSHPYVDATRGALSILRGPIVYCAEQQDNAGNLDDVLVSPADLARATTAALQLTDDGPADAVVVTVPAVLAQPEAPAAAALYPELGRGSDGGSGEPTREAVTLTLVPYYLWGNRDARAMRVWLRQN